MSQHNELPQIQRLTLQSTTEQGNRARSSTIESGKTGLSTESDYRDERVNSYDEIFSSSTLFESELYDEFENIKDYTLTNVSTELKELNEIKQFLQEILNKLRDEDTKTISFINPNLSYKDLRFLGNISDCMNGIMDQEIVIANKQEIKHFKEKILDPICEHYQSKLLEQLENEFYFDSEN